jgi:hypothetical protein
MRANVPYRAQHGRVNAGLLHAKASVPKKEKKWICKLSPEQILDLRSKYEYQCYNYAMLMEHFQIDRSAVLRYVDYITARHLIPKKPQ